MEVFTLEDFNRIIDHTDRQYRYLIRSIPSNDFYPRSVDNNGNVRFVEGLEWTAGFFPGCLWYLFEITGDPYWRNEALNRTLPLKLLSFNQSTHDLGFILNNSFGHAIRHVEDTIIAWTIINAAKSLSTRYNEKVGCIKSFDSDAYSYPVIIDNMMNLEILFHASKLANDTLYRSIARNHASKTLKHFLRKDYSVYQIADFDPESGEIRRYDNRQGLDVESSWSRGQSWALYGFIAAYRETEEIQFLNAALNIADYIKVQLDDHIIPFWDYDAPEIPNEPLDVSALTVFVSALLELIIIEPQYEDIYFPHIIEILRCLGTGNLFSEPSKGQYFILNYSTGNRPGNIEVNLPIIYADYYLLEALLKYKIHYLE